MADSVSRAADEYVSAYLTQINLLKDEEQLLLSDEDNLKLQVEEVKILFKQTTASTTNLWNQSGLSSGSLHILPKDNAAPRLIRQQSEKLDLTLAAEKNVRRQIEVLSSLESHLKQVQTRLSEVRNQIVEKTELVSTLVSLKEDRKVLSVTQSMVYRSQSVKKWVEEVRELYDDLAHSSVETLASKHDLISQFEDGRLGHQPGLEDYLKKSSQRISKVLERARVVFDSKKDFVDPAIEQLMLSVLKDNARLRQDLNRITSLALQ